MYKHYTYYVISEHNKNKREARFEPQTSCTRTLHSTTRARLLTLLSIPILLFKPTVSTVSTIRPKTSKTVAETQPNVSKTVTEIRPNSSKTVAESGPTYPQLFQKLGPSYPKLFLKLGPWISPNTIQKFGPSGLHPHLQCEPWPETSPSSAHRPWLIPSVNYGTQNHFRLKLSATASRDSSCPLTCSTRANSFSGFRGDFNPTLGFNHCDRSSNGGDLFILFYK